MKITFVLIALALAFVTGIVLAQSKALDRAIDQRLDVWVKDNFGYVTGFSQGEYRSIVRGNMVKTSVNSPPIAEAVSFSIQPPTNSGDDAFVEIIRFRQVHNRQLIIVP